MTKTQLQALIDTADAFGIDAAYAQLTATAHDDAYEGECDAMAAERDDPLYKGPCGPDDDYDSRGRRYRPRVNEAGEPWWM